MYPYGYYPFVYIPTNLLNPTRGQVSRAYADIRGNELTPNLRGRVYFQDVPNGVEVSVEVSGLPKYQPAHGNQAPIGPHGFHIHEHGDCSVGEKTDPFKHAGEHWNPNNQPHGHHPGDFPVLFSNDGYARMTFFTNRFKSKDIVGKSIMIHENPDDYRSQPSGNSGKRIGCGVIQAY
ncbi:superoxide dismutase family protein [Oceanobacillus caeni]|uniref:superoxide dismutase family protein n=1 Tax=Oceanobacillus caeni TaxID=405946 RepID=UPI00195EF9A9